MRPTILASLLAVMVAFSTTTSAAFDEPAVAARIESTLPTASKSIRQLAFDGDPKTYYASSRVPGAGDHFTMVLSRKDRLESVVVTTGLPDGNNKLEGVLELSVDGKKFEEVTKFKDGVARFEGKGREITALRLKPAKDFRKPVVVREIEIKLAEPIKPFAYPVEFTVDVTDAPEMKEWAEKAAQLCEAWYSRLNEQLKSEGYRPTTQISMTLRSDYNGVAYASGTRIRGSVKYFKSHPDDLGAMIHETCHVIQRYQSRSNPGWLVEGVADYVRFFVFEPGKAGRVNPDRAHYDQSYRTTATFLAYVSAKYDKDLVLKLNKVMREGKYSDDVFKRLTGKTVQELDAEWLASLR
jgi:hypothetical protein